jgi:hypothetical protein
MQTRPSLSLRAIESTAHRITISYSLTTGKTAGMYTEMPTEVAPCPESAVLWLMRVVFNGVRWASIGAPLRRPGELRLRPLCSEKYLTAIRHLAILV